LLRSLGQKKALGVFPSEPLRSPLAPALRARLRDGAHSQQNNGFVSFTYQTSFQLFQIVLYQGITSRPECQHIWQSMHAVSRISHVYHCINYMLSDFAGFLCSFIIFWAYFLH